MIEPRAQAQSGVRPADLRRMRDPRCGAAREHGV